MPRKPKFDVYATARTVIDEILKLHANGSSDDKAAEIPAIFAALPIAPMERYDVFQMLDEKPGLFGSNYWNWHAPLRRCRNQPDIGRKMFDTFKDHRVRLEPVQMEVSRPKNGRPGYAWVQGVKIVHEDGREVQPYMRVREARTFCKEQKLTIIKD